MKSNTIAYLPVLWLWHLTVTTLITVITPTYDKEEPDNVRYFSGA